MPHSFLRPVLTPAAASSAPAPAAPLVSLTTDFGSGDPWPAICRGVILSIAPGVRLLDVSHDVAKFSIADGAVLLWAALPYLPVGAHVAVVDPGVGTARRAIGVRVVRGDVLVGPDNGLLLPAAERLGGIVAVHALESPRYRLPAVSASFHGRDIFAPAGAHLALGVPLEEFGTRLDPSALVRLELPAPTISDGALDTTVVSVDSFGNVKLAGEPADLEAALGPLVPGDVLHVERPDVTVADGDPAPSRSRAIILTWQRTFGAVPEGDPLLYEDSHGRLCLAVSLGDAAGLFRLQAGDRVAIRRPAGPSGGSR